MIQNAIIPLNQEQAVEGVRVLAAIVRELREQVFVSGQDFGIIPGTGDKPVLLLPGMEKLMRALRLRPDYIERTKIVDFDKPLFFYEYECRLIEIDTDLLVSSAVGSANSRESKWRWRDAKRVCPKCGQSTINRSKYPPRNQPNAEPGWYCYAKAGGCGTEFAANDTTITGQTIGRVENPDIADQLNTICKIAQKRALASAIKGAANVSEFFTVDLEDLPPATISKSPAQHDVIDAEFIEEVDAPQNPPAVNGAQGPAPRAEATTVDHTQTAAVPILRVGNGNGAEWTSWTGYEGDPVVAATHQYFNGPDHYENTIGKLLNSGVISDASLPAERVAAITEHWHDKGGERDWDAIFDHSAQWFSGPAAGKRGLFDALVKMGVNTKQITPDMTDSLVLNWIKFKRVGEQVKA